METLKENTNLKYYESTKNYCLFLLDKITNDDKYLQGKSISKENYHMATLSIISSMFFEMKEDLIEKKDGNIKFKSTLLSNTKTAIKYLAKYENGKYIIDNFAFNDELTLFNTIRNKLAHGDFVIDEVPSRIIINVNGNKVRIRVEDLTNFVVSLFKSCFTIKDNNTYERNILFNPCKIQSRSEIRNYLKAFSKCKITLKSKNNTLEDEVVKKLGVFEVQTLCKNKQEMLKRPDLGRFFSEETKSFLKKHCKHNVDVQIYFGDGLCAPSIEANVPDLYAAIEAELKSQNISVGTPFFVRYCRVNTARIIAPLLGAKVTCVLIGERPGLLTSESMSAYIAYNARMDMSESEYTVVSNISRVGTPPVEAAAHIAELLTDILQKKCSGVKYSVL